MGKGEQPWQEEEEENEWQGEDKSFEIPKMSLK